MPRIPTYESSVPYQGTLISPEGAAAPYKGIVSGGEAIARTGMQLLQGMQETQERDRKAAQAVRSEQIRHDLEDQTSKFVEDLQTRNVDNFESYETDTTKFLGELKDRYKSQIGDDKDLALAFDRTFNHYSELTMKTAMAAKRKAITEYGLQELVKTKQRSIQDYATAPTEIEKAAARDDFSMTAYAMAQVHIISPAHAEEMIQGFDKEAQSATLITAKSSGSIPVIDSVIQSLDKGAFPALDLTQRATEKAQLLQHKEGLQKKADEEWQKQRLTSAYVDLQKMFSRVDETTGEQTYDYAGMKQFIARPGYLDETKVIGVGRPDKPGLDLADLGHLRTAIDAGANAAREQLKTKHDAEEQALSNALLTGKLDVPAILSSKYATGDEKVQWNNKLVAWNKQQDEKIDPVVEAQEYTRLNEMVVNPGIDPKVVKDSIIFSPRLPKAEKIKLIDRLGQMQDKEIQRGLKLGYEGLEAQIIPKRGIMEKVTQTPLELQRYRDSQNALDNWVDQQRAQGKPPSADAIYKKSKELGPIFTPSISERVEQQRISEEGLDAAEKAVEQRAKAQKAAPPTTPAKPAIAPAPAPPAAPPKKQKIEPEVGKIYNDAHGNRAKYLGEGNWQPVGIPEKPKPPATKPAPAKPAAAKAAPAARPAEPEMGAMSFINGEPHSYIGEGQWEKQLLEQQDEAYEIGKIYTDGKGKKQKYLGLGKWLTVK